MTHAGGRRLFGSPILLQDWDSEAEEGAAQYWELFLDLLLVAAASSVSDQFKENLTLSGLSEFVIFFAILCNSWILYSHHYSSRFQDATLSHSMILFVYIYATGCCIVNPGYENLRAFCWGALVVRASMATMFLLISCTLPRARYFAVSLTVTTLIAMVGLLVAIVSSRENEQEEPPIVVQAALWFVVIFETFTEIIIVKVVTGTQLVPINIEQTKERLGALELIMLGETILSVTLTYRELEKEKLSESSKGLYYLVLGLSFLLVFMFTLLFFHMQPSPSDHAFRRSKLHGTAVMIGHKFLALALLAVGVSIKIVVETTLLEEAMPAFASKMMGYGIGTALLILYGLRLSHYGGKDSISFGGKILHTGEDARLDRLVRLWWWTVGLAWLLPFIGIGTGTTVGNPLAATGWHAALLFLLCVVESFYSHTIEVALECRQRGDEERSLVGTTTTYQSVER